LQAARLREDVMRPLIGLNTTIIEPESPLTAKAVCHLKYIDAVLGSGGIPIIIPPYTDASMLDAALALLDGFCLIGGPDYDPAYYGGHPQDPKELMAPRRHNFDIMLGERLLKKSSKPVLGVCGGHQLISIIHGGKLVQDVRAEWKPTDQQATTLLHATIYREEGQKNETYQHEIKITPESRLAKIVGAKKIMTNSYHHQAVDPKHVGAGLRATAWAPDGIIEAIESTDDRFLLGVQWHPERQVLDHPEHKAIFDALVTAAKNK
jgi:putative glutamine amidotransferase